MGGGISSRNPSRRSLVGPPYGNGSSKSIDQAGKWKSNVFKASSKQDESLKLRELIYELTTKNNNAQPLRSASMVFIRHVERVLARKDVLMAGMFIRTELIEPEKPNPCFGMVAAEYYDVEEEEGEDIIAVEQLVEDDFVKAAQDCCQEVDLQGEAIVYEWTLSNGTMVHMLGFPVFKIRGDEDIAVQFKMEDLNQGARKSTAMDLNPQNTNYNSKNRRTSKVVAKPFENSKSQTGGIIVLCALNRKQVTVEEVKRTMKNSSTSLSHLFHESGGFLKQTIETEARMEHLYQCQRALAAAMDTTNILNQNEDIIKGIWAYERYIKEVLSVQECILFLFDDSRNLLWHQSEAGDTLRLPLSEASLPGKAGIDQVAMIQYPMNLHTSMKQDSLTSQDGLRNLLLEGGETNVGMLAVPVPGEKGLLGVVLVIEKTIQNQYEGRRIKQRSRAIPNTTGHPHPNQNQGTSRLDSSGAVFMDKLDSTNFRDEDDVWSRSPAQYPDGFSVYFTDYDTALLEATLAELAQVVECKFIDLNYLMQSRDVEEKDDLQALLAMYDPLKRRSSRRISSGMRSNSFLRINTRQSSDISAANTGATAVRPSDATPHQEYTVELKLSDAQLLAWDLDVLSEDPCALVERGAQLFQRFDLLSRYKIPPSKLYAFLNEVKASYLPNPYHNWAHGYSVLHAVAIILHRGARDLLKVSEILGLFIAAVAHDVGHPGTNNDFQIHSGSQLALLYNDISVLENFHASKTFQVLQKEGCNVLSGFDVATRGGIRQVIVQAILSTDISKHFKLLQDLKGRYHEAYKRIHHEKGGAHGNTIVDTPHSPSSAKDVVPRKNSLEEIKHTMGKVVIRRHGSLGGMEKTEYGLRRQSIAPDQSFRKHSPLSPGANALRRNSLGSLSEGDENDLVIPRVKPTDIFNCEERNDRLLVIQTIIQASDLSNPVLPFELYKKWSLLVVEEFYKQALQEKALGLPSQPLMKNSPENTLALATLQLNFIDYVVGPLWEIVKDIFGDAVEDRYEQLEQNREQWKQIKIHEEQMHEQNDSQSDEQ